MKESFTIGEISSLLGLTSHTLRYYDKIGLIRPAETNAQTGYRKYSYEQVFALERIRYLQSLGLSLEDIGAALKRPDVSGIVELLEFRQAQLGRELEDLTRLKESVDNYLEYYHYLEDNPFPDVPFKTRQESRWILAEPYLASESVYGTAGYRLMRKKSEPAFSDLRYLRQIGFLLDVEALLRGEIKPTHYYIFLKEAPAPPRQDVMEIPGGTFLCVRGRILNGGYENRYLREFFPPGSPQPRFALANEYEESLDETLDGFSDSNFEIQVPL